MRARHWLSACPIRTLGCFLAQPGSEIRNPQIRTEFYRSLRRYHDARTAAVATADALNLAEQDLKIRSLTEACL